MTKILSWNVNSLRIRLPELVRIASEQQPDVVCLQEVKAKEEDFPFDAVKAAGFEHIALYGMAGYNGVAILSRRPLKDIRRFDWAGKADARHISAVTDEGIEIHNIYIPAGGDLPDPEANPAFARKLQFIEALNAYFASRATEGSQNKIFVCGDFNVAPSENDVWNHKQLLKIVSHTPAETSRLQKWYRESGLIDALRQIYPEPEKIFSWWSYRNPNWQTNNKGRRLDHIWISPALATQLQSAFILKDCRGHERPSDHVPVGAVFE